MINTLSAEAVLCEKGFLSETIVGTSMLPLLKEYRDGIAVELHSDYFDPNSMCYGTISDAFLMATQTGVTYSYSISDTAFYLYNLLHCVKHYL